MESVYFALSAVAAALIIHWAWQAQHMADGAHRGLLAMRRPDQPAADANAGRGKRKRRR